VKSKVQRSENLEFHEVKQKKKKNWIEQAKQSKTIAEQDEVEIS
jgi:hypothetical protein